ncbi:MAG: hypothetical protein M1831_000027 [Alyxoria varia]|nr:MAG: hypothetical protein M1831_000027 [Alyxoria varia]
MDNFGNADGIGTNTNADNPQNPDQGHTFNNAFKLLAYLFPGISDNALPTSRATESNPLNPQHQKEAELWDKNIQLASWKAIATALFCGLAYFAYAHRNHLRTIERLRARLAQEGIEMDGEQAHERHGWRFWRFMQGEDPVDYLRINQSLGKTCMKVLRDVETSLERTNSDIQERNQAHDLETENQWGNNEDAETRRRGLGRRENGPGEEHARLHDELLQEVRDRVGELREEVNFKLHEQMMQEITGRFEQLRMESNARLRQDLTREARDRVEECHGVATSTLREEMMQEVRTRVEGLRDQPQARHHFQLIQGLQSNFEPRQDEAQVTLHQRLMEEMANIIAKTEGVADSMREENQQNEQSQLRPDETPRQSEDRDGPTSDQAHERTQEMSTLEAGAMAETMHEETPLQDENPRAVEEFLQRLEDSHPPRFDEAHSRLHGEPMQEASHGGPEQGGEMGRGLEETVQDSLAPSHFDEQAIRPDNPPHGDEQPARLGTTSPHEAHVPPNEPRPDHTEQTNTPTPVYDAFARPARSSRHRRASPRPDERWDDPSNRRRQEIERSRHSSKASRLSKELEQDLIRIDEEMQRQRDLAGISEGQRRERCFELNEEKGQRLQRQNNIDRGRWFIDEAGVGNREPASGFAGGE